MPEEQSLRDQITEIRNGVRDISVSIQGNEVYGQKGIKHTLQDHSDRLQKLEKNETQKWLKVGVTSGGIGGMLGVLFPKAWLAKLIAWLPF